MSRSTSLAATAAAPARAGARRRSGRPARPLRRSRAGRTAGRPARPSLAAAADANGEPGTSRSAASTSAEQDGRDGEQPQRGGLRRGGGGRPAAAGHQPSDQLLRHLEGGARLRGDQLAGHAGADLRAVVEAAFGRVAHQHGEHPLVGDGEAVDVPVAVSVDQGPAVLDADRALA